MLMRRRIGPADLVKGAVAGGVATWAMDRVTGYLYEHESADAKRTEDRVRHGRTAYETAALKTARLLGTQLNEEQRKRFGAAIHWALGMAAGAAYAGYGRNRSALRRAGGAAFGTTFWAAVDEGLVSFLGLTPPPTRFPLQTHARGLLGHVTFGVVTDRTLRLLDAVT